MKLNNILLLTHTQYRENKQVPGPVDSLLEYFLNVKANYICYVQHSIFQGNGTRITHYQNGAISTIDKISFQKNFPNPLRYVADFVITLNHLYNSKKFSVAVAADPLNFFYAFVLKRLNKIQLLYFYTLDYSPNRFNNPIMNNLYQFLDRFAVSHCDYSISACKKICDVRKTQGLSKTKNLYLPNSPILEDVKIKKMSELNQNELVMVFSDPSQIDFKIIFESVKALSKKHKNLSLKLIGRGNFKVKLARSARKHRILNRIKFLDTPTHKDTLEEISSSAIGLECNNNTVSWNEYREPLKIREYFALGLPVISKKGHALVDEIEEQKLGFIITNSADFIAAAEYYFDHPKKYLTSRKRILKYSEKFDKQKNISKIFK